MTSRAWSYLFFFSAALFMAYSDTDRSLAMNLVYRTSVVALAAGLIVGALLHERVMQLLALKWFDYCGPVLIAAGTLVIVPYLLDGTLPPTAPLMASAAGTGVGSALVQLSLGRRFVGATARSCIASLLWATVGSTALTFLFSRLPVFVALCVETTLPFLTVAILHRVSLDTRDDGHGWWSLGERISHATLLRFVVCAAVLGIVTGIMRDLYLSSNLGGFSATFQITAALLPVLACLVLAAFHHRTRCDYLNLLYRPAVLVCVAGFALIPVAGDDITVPYAVITTGYSLFELLVWAVLCEISTRFQYTSVQVFGFGRGIVLLVGVIAGTMAAEPLMPATESSQMVAVLTSAAIIGIVFLQTYVLNNATVTEFERQLDETEALADNVPLQNEDARPLAGAQGDDRSNSRQARTADGKGKQAFLNKCTIIGRHYGLTKREIEVLRLLAVGRNSVRIQEELTISAGTVKTHCYHIFQKLGIHSQQQVIDLLEHADLDKLSRG